MENKEIRRQHLLLAEKKYGSLANLAKAANVNESYLSQCKNGSRDMGARFRQKIEAGLGLTKGAWDIPPIDETVSQAPSRIRAVPLVSCVQAGDWCEASDPFPPGAGEDYISVEASIVSSRGYALRVHGESMEPKFYHGDILIVDPAREPRNGSYVIAKRCGHNDATFKQLVIDGGEIYLKALNPNWPDRFIKITEEWTVCGVVVQRMETFV